MSNDTSGRVHWSFWVIAAVTLIWNAMGVLNFFMQLNASSLATMSESQRAIIEHRPMWATAAFAVAVLAGAAGCLLLLFRKAAASVLLVLSLVAMVVHMIPYLGMIRSASTFGPVEIVMFILMPLAVAMFLVWYGALVKRRGWVR
jgi:hypothetical protein